jgi:homoserine acetyltransferase
MTCTPGVSLSNTCITVEEIGGVEAEKDNMLLCCGKPMKDKATVKKAVKK